MTLDPRNGGSHHTCTRTADFEEIKADIREIKSDAKKSTIIGTVRPVLPSLDYGEGPDTAVQDRPQLVARRKVAERDAHAMAAKAEDERVRRLTVEEECEGLRATLAERDRQDELARAAKAEAKAEARAVEDQRWSRAQKIGAGVVALITAMGGGATLMKLLGD